MRRIFIVCLILLPVLLLSACSIIPALPGAAAPSITPTDCGCSATGPGKTTPTVGLVAAGPGAPSANTPAPGDLESLRDQWKTYTNAEYKFSFDYPAAYDNAAYNFCTAREASTPPQDALLAVDLGSRTKLTLAKTDKDVQSAADAFRASHTDATFDAPAQRTVGGVPGLTLAYRSGGTNRYSEATLFVKDGVLYTIESGTPSACDVPPLSLTELSAYSHVLDSFKFQ